MWRDKVEAEKQMFQEEAKYETPKGVAIEAGPEASQGL